MTNKSLKNAYLLLPEILRQNNFHDHSTIGLTDQGKSNENENFETKSLKNTNV